MKIAIDLLIIFCFVTAVVFLFLSGYSRNKKMNNRIKEFLPSQQMEETNPTQEKRPSLFKRFFLALSTIFKNVQLSKRTEKLLLEAGSKLKPEEFYALRILTPAGIGVFAALIGLPWYLITLVIIIGFIIPINFMKRKRRIRLARVNHQLIEVLGTMANSMRAGFSFMQAMQLVGKEIPDPIGPEFDRVVRQAGLGMPFDDVMEELVERLPNKELDVVVRAILAQRQSGGNLAELLETMEETIRGRVRILEELKTLTAQGRMSSWIITLLPVALGLYLALVNWEYFAPMLQHPLGWMMIFVGATANIIGWLFIQKIIRIEV